MSLKGSTEMLVLKYQAPRTNGDAIHFTAMAVDEFLNRNIKMLPFMDHFTMLDPGSYEFHISTKHIERLKNPYPSNCTDQHPEPNPLSKMYSHPTCFENCQVNRMWNDCGDVVDFYKEYAHKDAGSTSNLTDQEKSYCVWNNVMSPNPKDCNCPMACKEVEYNTRVRTHSNVNFNGTWEMFVFIEDNKVTMIHEVPDFTLEELLGAAGGILGLTMGASILSLVELFVYCVLYLFRKLS